MAIKDIRPALRAFLLADATIAAVVSTRVYPVKLPQGTNTASLVYNLISEVGDAHNEGPDGLCSARIQIDAYAPTADAADVLARAVKERLFGYRGTMGTGGSAVEVKGVFIGGSARSDFDDEAKMHHFGRDFIVSFWDR